MQSNRSEYSHRRQYGDRSSKQWDEYDDRWEERRESHRDLPQDYVKYDGDGPGRSERTNRSREYSDLPNRQYSKDSSNRDWSRKNPVRRRMSSPVWDASEKKRQRFAEDDQNDYRYRCDPREKPYRQSADSFSHAHSTKNFKDTRPQEEDFKYRETPQDSSHRYQHDDFINKQRHVEVTYRRMSLCYKDRGGRDRSQDRSQERPRSQDRSTKNYVKPRDSSTTSTYREDYDQNVSKIWLNGSSRQMPCSHQSFESDVSTQCAVGPDQKSTKGFQRFLDVLNKGVNVDMLTKIVTQTSARVAHRPPSPSSFTSAADRPWSPSHTGRQQERHKNSWSDSHGVVSPPPRHRSLSPKTYPLPDEESLQRRDGEQNYFNSRPKSPSMTLTPEDENKRRQMQDVLQAIGVDLGFDELGQMSHRIRERLYGRKDSDQGRKVSREGVTRQAYSPRHRSTSSSSSSSRSSFTTLRRDYSMKEDLYSPQRDVPEVHQAQEQKSVDFGQKTGSSSLQDIEKCEFSSQESAAAAASQAFSISSSYTVSEPPPAPVMPTYSPVAHSPLSYRPLNLAVPPIVPHAAPGLFLPPQPPVLPYPGIQPLSMFPPVLAQTRLPFPQQLAHLQPQPLNAAQKAKPVQRHRCLQVIETKPG